MPADSSAWYSDPDSLLATLQKSQRPMARTPEIPGYTGLRELRRGGQGVVYIATQVSTKRTVAIKVLAAGAFASVSARRRFEREIDLAATLDHPNIVSVYDSGETIEGHPYFVMRYIDGVAFDAIVGPFATPGVEHTPTHARPIRESLELALRICDAIGYAHRRGVIHRDLKPSNIRIDRDGGPHILDFGLAKASSELFEGDIPTQMSMTGEFMGSLPWASPEQTEGISEKIDIRTDVYSFGVLLYQMLTGRFPYGVTGPFRQVLESICHASPAPPSKFRSEIDNDLETIVLKSLEKSPDRRYQSMPELAADIRHYLAGEPIAAKRDSALYTMRKNLARYRVAVAAGLAFVLLAVASAATMAVLYQRANRAAALALTSKNEAIDARDDAESQRRIAVVEAETAKQINKMLTSMLSTSLDTGREARVADALDSARDQLARSEAMSSAVRTELQNTIGISYATLGLLDEAVPLFNEAYEIQRAEFGEDDPRTLHTLTNRAWIERLQGHLDESELLYRDAVRRWTTIKDADSIEAATAKNDLALVLQQLSRHDEAEKLLREASSVAVQHFGPTHPESLRVRMNLSSVLHSRGALAEARDELESVLETSIATLGADHLDTLGVKNTLAQTLIDLGQIEEARALAQDVYDGRARSLGENHPSTIQSLSTLGNVIEAGGDIAGGYKAQQEAYRRSLDTYGPHHILTVNVKGNLASITSALGNLEESIRLHREIRADYERRLGDDHEDTLRILSNLGTVLMQAKRWAEAAEILGPAVERLERVHGTDHPMTLSAKGNYSAALREIGRVDEARALAQYVTDTRVATLGPNHFDTLVSMLNLAEAESADGEDQLALRTARTVYTGVIANYGEEHWVGPVVLGTVGRMTAKVGQKDEALEIYEQALEGLVRKFGEQHYRTQTVLERLLDLAGEMGRDDMLEKYAPLREAIDPLAIRGE